MKVLNYTTSYFAIILLLIISAWATIFYYAMLDEIYDSIDDGLDNQKGLILQKVNVDSTILKKTKFEEADYSIQPITEQTSISFRDVYIDTLMYMQNENDFEPVRLLRTAFGHDGKYYLMQVVTSMVEEDDLISELFYALLWLYLGLVASILVLNNFLLKRIWRPFYHLLGQLKDFRLEEQTEFTLKKTKIDEFRMLNETTEKLIRSNINAYNNQKEFVENAAHELQTPLAISLNKLETLAESGDLSDAQTKLLASALDNLDRLTRLNKSLLLLSRIANKQFKNEQEIDLNNLVRKTVEDFSDHALYRKITLNISELENVKVRMNPDLAGVMVTNLVKNAVIHNRDSGSVEIVLTWKLFQIRNTGKHEAINPERLFSRFNNDHESPNSTGLGLAIVKAIADLYSFKVSYTFDGEHMITITL